MFLFPDFPVLLKGAGDLGTGVAYRLHRAGFPILITELAQPLAVRRTVAFATAVYEGRITVEGMTAQRAESVEEARRLLNGGILPVLVAPEGHIRSEWRPRVLVDAIMAKHNTGTRLTDAPLVVALGPGFTPGLDCHAVVETNRGHNLGRVLWDRAAEPDTGVPGQIGGQSAERVLRAPCDGVLLNLCQIGDPVAKGQMIARVNGGEVIAPFGGVLRGLLREGITVKPGMKIGDIDPRAQREACFTISDKSLAVGGGVLEAILSWINR